MQAIEWIESNNQYETQRDIYCSDDKDIHSHHNLHGLATNNIYAHFYHRNYNSTDEVSEYLKIY